MPLSPSFVFVPAALLVACLAALVSEVSLAGYVSESSWETAFSCDKFVTGVATWDETDSLNSVWQSQKSILPGPFQMKEEQKLKALSHQFWKDFCLRFFQASWEVELLIIFCKVAVLIVFRMMHVKVPVVGAETFSVFGELWEERKEEEKEEEEEVTQSLSEEVEERKDEFLEPGQSFPIFVEGAGKTCVFVISADMTIEDLEHSIQEVMCLPEGLFFLTLSGKLLDANRMQYLVRDVSVRVNFRLRGGMMRVPKDSPGQWTCDYCRITRCWATRSTCYRCGEARGHTEDLQRHYQNMAREAREKGTSNSSVPVASSSSSPPWSAKAPPPRSVPPRASSAAPWASSKPLSEVDKVHDSDQTALLRAALALFENCDLPPGILDEIRKIGPPHRPPTRGAPNVSREQVVLNMKKKLEKEEQDRRERVNLRLIKLGNLLRKGDKKLWIRQQLSVI